jgi:hypothetical protein
MFDISEIFRNGGGVGSSSQLDRQRGEVLDDPAPSWRYSVQWPEIGSYHNAEFVKNNIVAETITFPMKGMAPISRHAGATMKFFPDFRDMQGFNATFYLDQRYRALTYFTSWKYLAADEDGTYYESDNYKKDIELHVFSMDDSQKPVTKLQLFGVWVSEVNPIELSYENSDRLRLEVTFSVDASDFMIKTDTTPKGSGGLGSILQTGQRILRTGRRGLREIKDITRLF